MALQRLGDPPLELLAVDQPGQGIVGRLMGQLTRQPTIGGDIAKGQHGTNDVPFSIADRCHRVLHRDFAAVTPTQLRHAARLPAERLPIAPQHGADRVKQTLAGDFIEQAIDLVEGPVAGLLLAPAGQLFSDRVEVAHPRIGPGGNHAVANRGQRDLRQHLLLKQLLLDAPALGDIANQTGVMLVLQRPLTDRQLGDKLVVLVAAEQHFLLGLAARLRQRQPGPVALRHQPVQRLTNQ